MKKAIEMEKKGYSKPDMTKEEIREERFYFDQQVYSLDFMVDDDEVQCEQEIKDVIIREVFKTKE